MKRIFLFLVTNLAVVFVLSIVLHLLGVDRLETASGGLDINNLLIFSAVFGFGGALISLALSKWSAKRAMGVQVIDQPRTPREIWLVNTVQRCAEQAGIGMPEVGIFDSPEMNAFATGARRNAALVAVSTGLLNTMTQAEAEAVIGHEITHVANGDMVTLTLIQGVVNTFVIFLSRVIGYVVDRIILKNERGHGIGYMVSIMVSQLVLGMLASVIVMWFSRQREFRADAGGAKLAGRTNMIAALERLMNRHSEAALPDKMAAFGISGGKGMSRLFMTHPPLEERIAALKNAQ
jgi:heat shock protein HtpX